MKPHVSPIPGHFPLTQLSHNSTTWIGHLQKEPGERRAGQIFECPADGFLDQIELFAASVPQGGELFLTFHMFNPKSHAWGPVLGAAETTVQPVDRDHWISFKLPHLRLEKKQQYGFRVQSQGALVAIGETALSAAVPVKAACEWNGDGMRPEGRFFHYFSLAFKVEMQA